MRSTLDGYQRTTASCGAISRFGVFQWTRQGRVEGPSTFGQGRHECWGACPQGRGCAVHPESRRWCLSRSNVVFHAHPCHRSCAASHRQPGRRPPRGPHSLGSGIRCSLLATNVHNECTEEGKPSTRMDSPELATRGTLPMSVVVGKTQQDARGILPRSSHTQCCSCSMDCAES